MSASLLDLLTMIQAARHTRGADQARHLERAENTCRGILGQRLQAAMCVHDSGPCDASCTFTRALHGRCGRAL